MVSQIPSRRERPKNRAKSTQRTTKAPPISVSDDDDSTDQCPEEYGYFADADQCDKYYACNNG